MAVVIQQLGRVYGSPRLYHYEVRINQRAITTFTHTPADGLAVCLARAAEAVRHEEGHVSP